MSGVQQQQPIHKRVLLFAFGLLALAPAQASEGCVNMADVGAQWCYQTFATAENCASYYKAVGDKFKFCKWQEGKDKCQGNGGVETDILPENCVVEASPVECMYAVPVGYWCNTVGDMDTCPQSYQQFDYEGETRFRGCAVVNDQCKGKGEKFGTTMPLTCEAEDEEDSPSDECAVCAGVVANLTAQLAICTASPPVPAVVRLLMTAENDVSDYDATAQASLVTNMASTLGVAEADVTLTVTAASVNLVFEVSVVDDAEAETVTQQANALLGTAADATTALGVLVQSDPVTETVAASPSTPPPPPPSMPPSTPPSTPIESGPCPLQALTVEEGEQWCADTCPGLDMHVVSINNLDASFMPAGICVVVDATAGDVVSTTLTDGDDCLVVAGDNRVSDVNGRGGNDLMCGGPGNDDNFRGDDGNDTLNGGPGADNYFYGGYGDDTFYGGPGDDFRFGGGSGEGGDDKLYGGDGDDKYFSAGAGDDTLHGGAGDDENFYGDAGDDTLYGGDGDDYYFIGGDGDDMLYGGDGDDKLFRGGDGDDKLYGEDGDDQYFYGGGGDNLVNP